MSKWNSEIISVNLINILFTIQNVSFVYLLRLNIGLGNFTVNRDLRYQGMQGIRKSYFLWYSGFIQKLTWIDCF